MKNIKYNIINELWHPILWEEDKNKLINEAIIQHNLNFVIPMMKRNDEFKKTQNILISDLKDQKDENEEIIKEQEAELDIKEIENENLVGVIKPLTQFQEIKKYEDSLNEQMKYIKLYNENENKINEINLLIDENKENKTMVEELHEKLKNIINDNNEIKEKINDIELELWEKYKEIKWQKQLILKQEYDINNYKKELEKYKDEIKEEEKKDDWWKIIFKKPYKYDMRWWSQWMENDYEKEQELNLEKYNYLVNNKQIKKIEGKTVKEQLKNYLKAVNKTYLKRSKPDDTELQKKRIKKISDQIKNMHNDFNKDNIKADVYEMMKNMINDGNFDNWLYNEILNDFDIDIKMK